MAKQEAKRFLFNCEWKANIMGLPDKSRLRVYEAIIDYADTGAEPKLNPIEKVSFEFVRKEVDRAREKYDVTCQKRKQAIEKRWEKERIQKNTNVYDSIEADTNVYKPIQTHTNTNTNTNTELSNDNNQKEITTLAGSKEKAQAPEPKKKSSEWKKPTVEEIRAYAEEKGYTNVVAEDFWDFYESKGWMVGSNHMTTWHSSVALWNRSEHRQRDSRHGGSNKTKTGFGHFEGERNPDVYEQLKQQQKQQEK